MTQCSTYLQMFIYVVVGLIETVKICQQVAKLCQKLKWLVFFWDTVVTCCDQKTQTIVYSIL